MSEGIEHSALVSELQSLPWNDVKCMAIYLDCMDLAVLDKIEEGHPTSTQRVMYAMNEWLHRDTEASWAKVVSALREIHKNALAAEIEGKYCAAMTTPKVLEPTPPLSSHFAASQPPSSVLATASNTEPKHIAIPSQDEATCSPVDEILAVKNKVAMLRTKFIRVLIHTKICFMNKEDKSKNFLRDFKVTLKSLPHENKEFLKEEIKKAQNVDEIFDILEPYCNYADYDLLEFIIEEFGTSKLQEEMEKYVAELEQFEKKTTVHDFSLATQGGKEVVPAHYREMTIKLDKDPKRFTLHDARQFKKSVEMSCEEYASLFRGVSCSSVVIFLAFPPEAYAKLSEVVSASQFRKEHEVVSVVFSEGAAASLPKRQKLSLHHKALSESPTLLQLIRFSIGNQSVNS